MSCKYCDPDFGASVNDDAHERLLGMIVIPCGLMGNLSVELLAENDVLTLYTANGIKYEEKQVKINYCPMCGRKVREAAKK